GRRAWLWMLLAGVILAGWSKLTGLLLVGGFALLVGLWMVYRRQLSAAWLLPMGLVSLIAVLPYLAMIWSYGNPAPDTAALKAVLAAGSEQAGWADRPRLSPPAYVLHFASDFLQNWLPTLKERNALQYAALVLPFTAVACAAAGVLVSLGRVIGGRQEPGDVVVVAGWIVLAGTFAIHLLFSYRHHVETGWMMDAYPRYYLPLAAIVPLACLSLLAAVPPAMRRPLAGFFIIQPILFQLLGAPI
ncbi:MAG: hypothetical protein ACRCVA_02230, partial [Phreatobacter sp.]